MPINAYVADTKYVLLLVQTDIVVFILMNMDTCKDKIFLSLGSKWKSFLKFGKRFRKDLITAAKSIIDMYCNKSVQAAMEYQQEKTNICPRD